MEVLVEAVDEMEEWSVLPGCWGKGQTLPKTHKSQQEETEVNKNQQIK